MKLKERLILVALLFIGFFLFVSINFLASPGPGPKEPSENGPTSTVDVMERVRASMRLDLMRFLQAHDQHRRTKDESLHKVTASSSSTSHASPTTRVSNHSGTKPHPTLPVTSKHPWQIWTSWVKPKVFYSPDDFWSAEMNTILHALATYPVTSLELGHRGTQLKASMYLQGGQRTVFKPMRCGIHAGRKRMVPHSLLLSLFPSSLLSPFPYKIRERHYSRW